jgi:hypothetical protein
MVVYDSAGWRIRAQQMRNFGQNLNDEHSRAMALQLADDYEQLARQAEEREMAATVDQISRPA